MLFQLVDSLFGSLSPLASLKHKGPGHHADGQGTLFARHLGDDRRCAGAGTAAHPGGDKDHVRAFQDLVKVLDRFSRCLLPLLRVAPGSQSPSRFFADVDASRCVRQEQGLGISVDGDKINATNVRLDHAINGVAAAAAHANHPNPGKILQLWCSLHKSTSLHTLSQSGFKITSPYCPAGDHTGWQTVPAFLFRSATYCRT